ncbi:MAG: molybdopterin-binding protein, partial [Nitrososphaeria archaeon]
MEFRRLCSVEEALKNLIGRLKMVEKEVVSIYECYSRVLAEDVYAKIDVPPFDRAAMDGYALKAEDTFWASPNNPTTLKIVGKIEAGEIPDFEIKSGEAAEISTGAAIPKGANAVVMVENTRKFGDHVEVLKAVVPGENIIYAGSDIMCGELIARKGTKLSHREIGVLAACGIKEVNVFRRPKVAVISTGNELVEVGSKLEYGKIYDVNSYMLSAAVRENGGEAILLGIARDDESEILEKIKKGLEIADIVITSGSTSAGVGDIMYRILNSFKPGVLVHGIAVKPGKPTIVAFNNGKPIIALPGYPTSAMTVFELLVAPIIRRLSGLHEEERRKLKAKLSLKVFSAEGRRELLPIYIVEGNKKDEFFAYPVSGHYSGAVSTL